MTTSDRTSYAVGFKDLDAEIAVDQLPVTGSFPQWLSGTLLRTGPAKFDIGLTTVNHWFDGLAMLHRFGFDKGRVSYRNRFLESKTFYESTAKGHLARGGFATDP
jgi:carotenoid cleavage dioxygenase-like enzyme